MLVNKSSKVTILRPEFFSITLGIFWAFFVVIITLVTIASGYTGNLVRLFQVIYPWYNPTLLGLIPGLFWGFVNGYLLGFFIGYIYMLLIRLKVEKVQDFIFEVDVDEPINIIQEGNGDKPFTIVFVANPLIKRADGAHFDDDPIVNDSDLFYKVVTRCLRSFVNNELLRLPEIFPRLKLITVFDTSRRNHEDSNALCEELSPPLDILAARSDVDKIVSFLTNTKTIKNNNIKIEYADIIYVISASEKLTRSTARFTEDAVNQNGNDGEIFKFTFTNKLEKKLHAYNCKTPGVVALSAWDDRLKTPVHEFAHAMSSLENGCIVDEYVDKYDEQTEDAMSYIINRKNRIAQNNVDPYKFPIPDVFTKYQFGTEDPVVYFSDRYRTDKEYDWTSYVPERINVGESCIMDIAYYGYKYDKLIFDFMYDRLLVKLNRKV